MRKWIALLIALFIVGTGGFVCFKFYSYVFSKPVDGEVLRVERVSQPEALIANGRAMPAEQLFSFAVAIRDGKGEIHTASSEDRQWAVVQAGQCARRSFTPTRRGTWTNQARSTMRV